MTSNTKKYDLGKMRRFRDVWKRYARRQSDSGVKIMHVSRIVLFRKFRRNAKFFI